MDTIGGPLDPEAPPVADDRFSSRSMTLLFIVLAVLIPLNDTGEGERDFLFGDFSAHLSGIKSSSVSGE